MEEGAVFADTDIQFTIIRFGYVNIRENFSENIFNDLAAISCPLKVLDMFH